MSAGFLGLVGCGVYSFTGAALSPQVHTVSIGTFVSRASLGPSSISLVFTEMIKDYFQQKTRLTLTDQAGDLTFDGYIEDFTVTPVGASASSSSSQGDVSDLSRVTITVFASYTNSDDGTFDFEKRFSSFSDYDNSLELVDVEQDLMEGIFEQVIQDIFNESVANW